MRILVISDIHANLTAFDAVLENAKGEWDTIWCLGDMVGYGPDPNECIERLRELPHLCLAGNHDWAALGRIGIRSFNLYDRHAIEWTMNRLSSVSEAYLADLPVTFTIGDFMLFHAAPREPLHEYILDPIVAAWNFPHFDTPYCFVGHSFQPSIFERLDESGHTIAHKPQYHQPYKLGEKRLIINPGSVGIRAYGEPFTAGYGLLNLETYMFEHRKVPYNGEAVVERGLACGVISPTQPRKIALTWH